jgi:hypothetical protein
MGFEADLKIIPGQTASGDLSAHQFKFVNVGASGVELAAVNGAQCDGVLQDKPSAAGRAASVAYMGTTKVKAGAVITKGQKLMSNALGLAVPATATTVSTAATKTASAATYNLNPADTIVLDVDNVGNATATWDAAAATITDTTAYAVADQDGLTMTITITGGEYSGVVQTVTFVGATTTAALVASGINAQARGVQAAVVGGQVVLTTDGAGTGFAIATGAGTGALTWAAAVAGTGDAADINAVTAAELKTVIEADTTATVTITGTAPVIDSPTTGTTSELDFISGNALTPMGLSVETIVGTSTAAQFRGKALEAASASGELIAMTLAPTGKV